MMSAVRRSSEEWFEDRVQALIDEGPRRTIQKAMADVTNNRSRTDNRSDRTRGVSTTSALMELLFRGINGRVKGTEEF